MYILCEKPPSSKKTPLVYEMDRHDICPVCGEAVKTSTFYTVTKNVGYAINHIISSNPDWLILEKKCTIYARTFSSNPDLLILEKKGTIYARTLKGEV